MTPCIYVTVAGLLPICLPDTVYERLTELTDITTVGDTFRKFLDPVTGGIHDGAVYARYATLPETFL